MMRLIKFANGDQTVTAIAGEPGRLYTHLVWIDSPIRVRKVSNEEVERFGRPYVPKRPTLKAGARTMLQAGKTLGITKGAKKFLLAAVRGE